MNRQKHSDHQPNIKVQKLGQNTDIGINIQDAKISKIIDQQNSSKHQSDVSTRERRGSFLMNGLLGDSKDENEDNDQIVKHVINVSIFNLPIYENSIVLIWIFNLWYFNTFCHLVRHDRNWDSEKCKRKQEKNWCNNIFSLYTKYQFKDSFKEDSSWRGWK